MYTLGIAANKTIANKVTEKNILNFDFNEANIHNIKSKIIRPKELN